MKIDLYDKIDYMHLSSMKEKDPRKDETNQPNSSESEDIRFAVTPGLKRHPTFKKVLNEFDDFLKRMSEQIEQEEKARPKGKKNKSGAGRPPMNPDEGPADCRINVRFTKQQRDELVAFMKSSDCPSISDFVRKLIIKELKKMKTTKVKDPNTF